MRELEEKAVERLPVVLPIIFYHGREQWQGKRTIIDLFGSIEVDKSLRPFIPQFEYLFYDFSTNGNEQLKGSVKLKVYLQLIRFLYSEDMEQIYSIVVQLEQANEMNYFETIILYLFNVSESFSVETLKERLTVKGEEEANGDS